MASGHLFTILRKNCVAAIIFVVVIRLAPGQESNGTADDNYESIERFDCNTSSCSYSDNWINQNYDGIYENETDVCLNAQTYALEEGFGKTAYQMCPDMRLALAPWTDCRKLYCEMYETIVQAIMVPERKGRFFGGEECRPLLDFNKTLCETSYRDTEAFCDCFCPALLYFDAADSCKREVLDFLLLGRRGTQLAERYSISSFCAINLCQFFETLGDPRIELNIFDYGGVPPKCKELSLPFRQGQCQQLISNRPYNPCPWEQDTGLGNSLRCFDNHECEIDVRNADSWSCCEAHDFRKQCPANWPVMCANPLECNGATDHCCKTSVLQCSDAAKRECSPLLSSQLAEWTGVLEKGVVVPTLEPVTTTMDPSMALLLAFSTTTAEPWPKKFRFSVSTIFLMMGGLGALVILVGMLCICKTHASLVSKQIFGAAMVMKNYSSDPVSVFVASGERPPSPRKKQDEEEEERREAEARRKELELKQKEDSVVAVLARAVKAAYGRGSCHLLLNSRSPNPTEETPLRDAIEFVQSEGLQNREDAAELIERASKWLRTLEAERKLVRVLDDVRPDLRSVAQIWHGPSVGKSPLKVVGPRVVADAKGVLTVWPVDRKGMPDLQAQEAQKLWSKGAATVTLTGRTVDGLHKSQYWSNVEHLTNVINETRAEGASHSLLEQAIELRRSLVARTHELPADRCVLDPEGEGIKVLPSGSRRAVWPTTGEAYTYGQDADFGDDEMPSRDMLGDVGVDECRPVCSVYVDKGKCALGRRCPWRHCKPLPGDSVREPLKLDDV